MSNDLGHERIIVRRDARARSDVRVHPYPLLRGPGDVETVAALEAGKIEPRSDLVEQIAVALGRRLRDFAEE